MSHFLGTHTNRLDAKGRVSVPAAFRASVRTLSEGGAQSLILLPSHLHDCIDVYPSAVFHAIAAPLDRLDMFSESHDDLAATLYANAVPIDVDRDGRIILPESLVAHAGLTDSVVFMGLGRIFQIWEPAAADRRRAEARTRARGVTLPGSGAPAVTAPAAPAGGTRTP